MKDINMQLEHNEEHASYTLKIDNSLGYLYFSITERPVEALPQRTIGMSKEMLDKLNTLYSIADTLEKLQEDSGK